MGRALGAFLPFGLLSVAALVRRLPWQQAVLFIAHSSYSRQMAILYQSQRFLPHGHHNEFIEGKGKYLTCNSFEKTDQWEGSLRSHDPQIPTLAGYIIRSNHWPQIWIFTSCNCCSSVCVLPSDKIDNYPPHTKVTLILSRNIYFDHFPHFHPSLSECKRQPILKK